MPAENTQPVERPPIVAVLGHVDHGKSTLLDFIRKANTVAKEAGGITQHVAAYEVVRERGGEKKRITFIDTPGHAAFQAIRSRGAKVADIAVLVVAADDGVKAQTLEALESIRSAGTPFVVAINKIDKPNADLARTQGSLLEKGVYLEQLGGDIPWAAISAKTGQGVDELLDLILLVAEMAELKGDPAQPASGYCVEAHRDPRRGVAATLIITNGTLKSGQFVRAGAGIAPVRIMEDHTGKTLKEATFSTPVTLVGFDGLPDAGAEFSTYKTKREAEMVRSEAMQKAREEKPAMATMPEDGRFHLPIIVRADTSGSLEAIELEVKKIGDEFGSVTIIQSAIGTISENDVKTAIAAGETPASIIGFSVAVERAAEAFAQERGVSIEKFDIIYKLTERLAELLKEKAPKRAVEEIFGRAKILKVFSSRRDEHLVGASVLEGTIKKGAMGRVMRRGTLVGSGKIQSIQHNKQTVDKVENEGEFGAQIVSELAPAPGDTLECFVTKMQ